LQEQEEQRLVETQMDLKKGYWRRNNLVKAEKCDLLADTHSTLNRLKDFFCELLYVRGVMLGRLIYTQLSQCPNLVRLRLMQILKKNECR
jgi:hypothetical protein